MKKKLEIAVCAALGAVIGFRMSRDFHFQPIIAAVIGGILGACCCGPRELFREVCRMGGATGNAIVWLAVNWRQVALGIWREVIVPLIALAVEVIMFFLHAGILGASGYACLLSVSAALNMPIFTRNDPVLPGLVLSAMMSAVFALVVFLLSGLVAIHDLSYRNRVAKDWNKRRTVKPKPFFFLVSLANYFLRDRLTKIAVLLDGFLGKKFARAHTAKMLAISLTTAVLLPPATLIAFPLYMAVAALEFALCALFIIVFSRRVAVLLGGFAGTLFGLGLASRHPEWTTLGCCLGGAAFAAVLALGVYELRRAALAFHAWRFPDVEPKLDPTP